MRFCLRPLAAFALAGVLVLPFHTAAEAQSRNQTRAYAGLALSFGPAEPLGAGVVVGVQSVRVNASDRLRGIDVNARYDFIRGFDRVSLAGLIGRRSGYLNLGAGMNPTSGDFFVTGAAQTRHLRAGVDYGVMSGTAGGYFEVNTLRRPDRYVPPAPPPVVVSVGGISAQ